MFGAILVPIYGSELSPKAIEKAMLLAGETGATLAPHGPRGLAAVVLGSETHKGLDAQYASCAGPALMQA